MPYHPHSYSLFFPDLTGLDRIVAMAILGAMLGAAGWLVRWLRKRLTDPDLPPGPRELLVQYLIKRAWKRWHLAVPPGTSERSVASAPPGNGATEWTAVEIVLFVVIVILAAVSLTIALMMLSQPR